LKEIHKRKVHVQSVFIVLPPFHGNPIQQVYCCVISKLCRSFVLTPGEERNLIMKRFAVIPLILILVVLSAIAFPRSAHAGDNPPGYDIEVQMLYCMDQSKPCNTIASIRNSQYTQVETVSFHPGRTSGTPDAVDFTCGRAYIDDDGVFHDVAEHVFAGFEGGTITGTAKLERDYSESSTHAEGAINWVHAFDPVTGDSGTAWGEISTNNVTDLRIGGGFNLVLNGPIYDESHPLNGPGVTKVIGHGTMRCDAYSRYQKTNQFHASGPYFEAVLNNSDND
jgi:hypothetical protein